MRTVLSLAVLGVIGAACGSEPTPPPPPTDQPITSFTFLDGSWNVTSVFVRGDGTTEETTGMAVVRSSLQGNARKEQFVGTRDGLEFEVGALFIESENNGQWVIARGNGAAGTFDVLEGSFSQSVGTFTSRSGTRPDGGQTRETYSDITDDSFQWQVEISEDAGQNWQTIWSMEYTRDAGGGTPVSPGAAAGCSGDSYREFDFWEGNWQVGGATNRLVGLVGGCILEENWSSSSEIGSSYNMYDIRTDLWYQVWTDDNANALVIYGGLIGEQMVLSGPRFNSLQRISWTPNANGTVRQHGQMSGDNGQSWTTTFDLTYVKQSGQ